MPQPGKPKFRRAGVSPIYHAMDSIATLLKQEHNQRRITLRGVDVVVEGAVEGAALVEAVLVVVEVVCVVAEAQECLQELLVMVMLTRWIGTMITKRRCQQISRQRRNLPRTLQSRRHKKRKQSPSQSQL